MYTFAAPLCLKYIYNLSFTELFVNLGIKGSNVVSTTLFPLALVMILFTGPLVDIVLRYIQDDYFNNIDLTELITFRNLVAAPVIEEVVFRGCMTLILKASFYNFTMSQIILFGSLPFGISHLHHFLEHLKSGLSPKKALQRVLFQLLYTTVFGSLVFFIFLRTEQLLSIISIHMFCNFMEVPSTEFNNKRSINYKYKQVIKISYFLGIAGFFGLLFPFTQF